MQLPPRPWRDDAAIHRIFAAIQAAGGELRFVGGCVRDALLERSGFDIDAACTLPPLQVVAALEQAGIRAVPTGLSHGTVTAISHGQVMEITTLRRDVACDGRRAEVAFTDDWREDAARRDFTMNALYADLNGTVYDYFGGLDDARAGHVRFIGDAGQRIQEDALRMLRFFRFFAHYGQGEMDAQALAACRHYAPLIEDLSGERIQTEMCKLLAAPAPMQVIKGMESCGFLPLLKLPKPAEIQQTEGSSPVPPEDVLRRLALWLRQDAESLEPLLSRWKFSNADKARLRAMVRFSALLQTYDNAAIRACIRREGKARFADYLWIAQAEQPQYAARFAEMRELAAQWDIPAFPLDGRDIMALGVQGKAVGQWLRTLEDWWEAQYYAPDKAALLAEAQARLAHTHS